ncbi:hypothetical protein PF008_g18540 [Phytophthora fragariae]|uniref:Uncharacterized protein n=1 Tax=Phytophthora fragariae TaxID=53985 RepID=A0A6G0R516_9STRA|nr:hypothetical protein PF008_g18540 [Phytophthora fragariae]
MKDEDGELHNVMLFAAKDDPNRYPMWVTGSFSGGGCGVETDTEAGLFTPLMVATSWQGRLDRVVRRRLGLAVQDQQDAEREAAERPTAARKKIQ